MSDQDKTPAQPEAAERDRPGRKPKARRERRGRRIASTDWATVAPSGYGLLQIASVNIDPEVTYADLEQADRKAQLASVNTYFTTPVDIFSSFRTAEEATGWRPRMFDFFYLWPVPLERRLMAYDQRRFGDTDADMRSLIDTAISVYEYNVFQYMLVKRSLQLLALALLAVITGLALFGARALLAGGVWMHLAPLAGLAAVAAVTGIYAGWNGTIYKRYYVHAVEHSVNRVSRPIADRMTSIGKCIEEYASHIDRSLTGGEHGHAPRSVPDRELNGGESFMRAQMLLWLPIRVLGIEWALRNRMEAAEKRHAIYAGTGFLLTLALLGAFLIVQAGMALLASLAPHPAPANALDWTSWGLIGLLGFCATAAGLYVSQRSYYNPAWNPAKHIMEQYFDTAKWSTFSKLEMDVRLAARVQRAMFEIAELDQKVGR
jgi:hypothetical protein